MWERENGIEIRSLEKPGWLLRFDVGAEAVGWKPVRWEMDDADTWLDAWLDDDVLNVACGPHALREAVALIRGYYYGDTIISMPARKLSVALEAPVAEAAKRAADRRGMSLSAWLNEASRTALTIEDGLAAVGEWEREHGSFTPEELAAADAALDRMGVARAR